MTKLQTGYLTEEESTKIETIIRVDEKILTEVWVVCQIEDAGDGDHLEDVIGVFFSEEEAKKITEMLIENKPEYTTFCYTESKLWRERAANLPRIRST